MSHELLLYQAQKKTQDIVITLIVIALRGCLHSHRMNSVGTVAIFIYSSEKVNKNLNKLCQADVSIYCSLCNAFKCI